MSVSPMPTRTLSDPNERGFRPAREVPDDQSRRGEAGPDLLWPHLSAIVFTMLPGQVHQPHKHEDQTQMWIIVSGQGEVLMEDGRTEIVGPGAIAVHHPQQLHGIRTVGDENLVYFTVAHKHAPA